MGMLDNIGDNMEDTLIQKIISQCIYGSCRGLFNKIDSIPYALIKGEALSLQAYGSVGLRHYNDIDLLVPREYISEMKSILAEEGFSPNIISKKDAILVQAYTHQLPPYYKKNNGRVLAVDVNHDIMWGEFVGKRINTIEFISDTLETELYGIKVKILPPIKALIQLILHTYKDMNSIYLIATRKKFESRIFQDVFFLLSNNVDEISIERLFRLSSMYEIVPYVYYVLYYTELVYQSNVIKKYVDAFRTDEGVELLDCYGLNSMERRVWKANFYERMASNDVFSIIESDLNTQDHKKIRINKIVFFDE